MCGIAGILTSNLQRKAPQKQLKGMISRLIHRGPDAQAVYLEDNLGLAHARLSIIDPVKSSNQPMRDAVAGNTIIFNGEIYNYIEIRHELTLLGHTFKTESDTEVILKAYAEWGIDCQNHFNGMWAFALYDAQLKKLFLSRDRLGIKPCVFGFTHQKDFVFASEAKALVGEFSELRQPNITFLNQFIQSGLFAAFEETFYQGIYNLMPGHYIFIGTDEAPVQKRYWNWIAGENIIQPDDQGCIEQFKSLLMDSIRLRFRSDVPVGACLSGGLDSGIIVGMATQLFKRPIHTFSCIYPKHPQYDESLYIQSSIEAFKTIPQFIEPHDNDLMALVLQSIFEQDGPTGGASVVSQRAVMQLAGQHVKVLLDGQGADELFGGYHPYFNYKIHALFKEALSTPSLKNMKHFMQTVGAVQQRTAQRMLGLRSIISGLKRDLWSAKNIRTLLPSTNQLSYMPSLREDGLNALLLEHTFTNLTDLLHYEDRNSMAFSVESRLPFLDYRLVEFAFSLNHQYKIRGGITKWMVYEAAKEVLPEQVLHRKDKMGFSTPASDWFTKTSNLAYLKHLIQKSNDVFSGLTPIMQRYLKSNLHSLQTKQSGDLNALWRFFSAHLWLDQLSKHTLNLNTQCEIEYSHFDEIVQ